VVAAEFDNAFLGSGASICPCGRCRHTPMIA
jgi:hypothetical protein